MGTKAIYCVSSEIYVLQAIIKNPENYSFPELDESIFIHDKASAMYKALGVLIAKKEPITNLSLLREANLIDESIDLNVINPLFENLTDEISEISIEQSIATLKEEKLKLAINEKLKEAISLVQENGKLNYENLTEITEQIESIVLSKDSDTDFKTLEMCFDEYQTDLELRKVGQRWNFCDPFLDAKLTRQASGGQIILISASTGIGKSAFALNLINNLINVQTPSLYFSLEMDKISTIDRLLAIRTQTPVSDWYRPEKINSLMPLLQQQKQILMNAPFRFIDSPAMSLTKIHNFIKKFKKIYKTDYVCVFVDLITQVKEFIEIGSKNSSLATTIEQAVNKLNVIAKEENVCFVCVAQMNRLADSYKISSLKEVNKLRPTLNEIKNSGALAERSRVVLSLFRPRFYIEKYLPDLPELEYMQDILEVTILKQNQGSLGVGKYLYKGESLLVLPLQEDEDTESGIESLSF